ncbi:hypothetical protein E0L36_26010 [Streptomyces sp. AJS327]|uniref:DUF6716 putative glycosyltransferase n=1 Tax=Streptomyces sp. AJS327 TaxID=2545265 RepID=UPI0015DEA385|nr:DUF6716 putative glycosyltransferase [Streptomyces sp. AJS327]MBA0054181.1 hypothetical protein [Streptomyces sp. AJS327]
MPSNPSSPPRVAVLADSDTRWKWGALTAHRLLPGARIDGLLLRGRATPTPRQLAEVGVPTHSLREVTGAEFIRSAATRERYDVLVLGCVGGAVAAMLHGLSRAALDTPQAARPAPGQRGPRPETDPVGANHPSDMAGWDECPAGTPRPVTVTGYVGVVYEKLSDGLLLRHGADVVLANSRADAERFRAVYRGVGADSDSVVECALPFLDSGAVTGTQAEAQRDAVRRPFTVVFAVQPSVPAGRADRAYLLDRAARHARAHPDREVLVKLRSRPGEHTTHLEDEPYQRLARRLPGGLPTNCRLVYGRMDEVLDRSDLLVTVSSTAALESLHRGIPTAVLTDLGVREALGNHYFIGSGCLVSWDQLDAGDLPVADADWASRHGARPGGDSAHAFDAAAERVTRLLARPELPPPAPYYTPRTAPGYLPGVLTRYGLAPDGSLPPSLPGGRTARDGAGVRRAVRGALRDAARGAYRHGVQRVAPLIRRMGEL